MEEEPEDIITDKTMNCRFISSNPVANSCDAVSNAYLTLLLSFMFKVSRQFVFRNLVKVTKNKK